MRRTRRKRAARARLPLRVAAACLSLGVVVLAAVVFGVTRGDGTAAEPGPCTASSLPSRLDAQAGPGNTGVPPGVRLSTVEGDYHTKADGQVIDRLDITGELVIDHDDVKVKCTRVRDGVTNNGKRLQMWLSTLGDPRGVRAGAALRSRDYTLRRVDILGTFDGLKAEGDVDVRDSYIHDLYRTTDSSQPNGMTHNDGVQIGHGSNMVFKRNTFYMWSFTDGETAGAHLMKAPYGDGEGYMTSAFMIIGGSSGVRDVLIEDNVIRGRTSEYVYVLGKTKRVRIVDNTIGQENRDHPKLFAVNDRTTVRGNVLVDGGAAR